MARISALLIFLLACCSACSTEEPSSLVSPSPAASSPHTSGVDSHWVGQEETTLVVDDYSQASGDPLAWGNAEEGTCWTAFTAQVFPEEVPCSDPHRTEVFLAWEEPATGDYDESKISQAVKDSCVIAAGAYSMRDYDKNNVAITMNYVSADGWEAALEQGSFHALCAWEFPEDVSGTFVEIRKIS